MAISQKPTSGPEYCRTLARDERYHAALPGTSKNSSIATIISGIY